MRTPPPPIECQLRGVWVKVPVPVPVPVRSLHGACGLAAGTLHNLLHKVNGVNGGGLRGSFITQMLKQSIELADAIRRSTNAEAVDNDQKADDVLKPRLELGLNGKNGQRASEPAASAAVRFPSDLRLMT
jgi:hypothetical protein